MWPLDANMDVHLVDVLAEFGIACDTAGNRGWKALSNGELVRRAVTDNFECLLTRDQLFGESAARALKAFPRFAVVLVNLRQQRWLLYRQQFLAAWSQRPIRPVAGQFTSWP
jgi:hypothetical protein